VWHGWAAQRADYRIIAGRQTANIPRFSCADIQMIRHSTLIFPSRTSPDANAVQICPPRVPLSSSTSHRPSIVLSFDHQDPVLCSVMVSITNVRQAWLRFQGSGLGPLSEVISLSLSLWRSSTFVQIASRYLPPDCSRCQCLVLCFEYKSETAICSPAS
jgi:hypothetical protein